jgi:hypothetical protein
MTAAPVVAGERRAWTRAHVSVRLGAIGAAVAALQAVLATAMPSPWIVPDELIYSEMAKSIASGHLPAVRGATTFSYGVVYPLLISPAWLTGNTVVSYAVAHVINAVLLASAVVPAYLLARRFVSERASLAVATLSVLIPSMTYASSLLVENALYPAVLWALLAMVRSYERPTAARQVVALAALGVAFEVKTLAVALLAAHVSIVLARPGRRRFAPTLWLVGPAAVVGGAAATVLAGSPAHVVGAYAVVLDHVDVTAVPWWFLLHVAELVLAAGVIPAVATCLVALRAPRGEAGSSARLFATVLSWALGWTVLAVAAFASWPEAGPDGLPATTSRIYERSTFFLLPLFLVGLAMWLEQPERRARRREVALAVAVALLPALLPISQLRFNANFQTLALVPWLSIDLVGAGWVIFAVVLAAAATACAFGAARRQLLTWLVVGAWFAVGTTFVYGSVLNESRNAQAIGAGQDRRWIDEAVGGGAQVAVLWREPGTGIQAPAARHRLVWLNEFFNRSVGPVYVLGAEMPYGLATTQVAVRDGAVVEAARGTPVHARFVLAACDARVAGTVVARSRETGMAVVETGGAVRVAPGRAPVC